MTAPDRPAPQRARGMARVTARVRRGRNAIGDLAMSGSSKLLFPRATDALQAVLLNSAGGITGGDSFALDAGAEPGAKLAMTTQAAERIYRALPGSEPGRLRTRLTLGPGARLDWLPQETMLFDGSALDRGLSIDMAADAHLLACEALVFGRTAMGERVTDLRLHDRIDLRIGGALAWADRLRLHGDAAAILARPGIADGAGAVATVIYAAPGAALQTDSLRAMLPGHAGVSALGADLLTLRILSVDAFDLKRHLGPVLRHLSGAELPRPWMI
ncbi:urease accessory protein UreD [Salipiger sp.]|uniref:urease accessory protein UreD n=1 Tax=Salipiger sp. TaxID=2078585 RepID=UPI003A96FACE